MEDVTPPMTKSHIDALTPFLAIFSAPGYRPYLPVDKMTMQHPDPPEVEAFRDAYLAVCTDVSPGAHLPEDPAGLDPTELYIHFSHPDVMATASANQIRRFLLITYRGDYHGFLATANKIASGVIPAALRRLLEVRADAPE
ncbi:MAG: hypothetical protein RLY87_1466 [Chloroflexota bacterium]|jgi:hypothetical protein